MTIVWEHGHAYQPRRIVDAILHESRDISGGVHWTLSGKKVSAANWFELMLKPGGVYDAILDVLKTRSIDVEPLTLHGLSKLNPEAYNRLGMLVDEGQASLFLTTYAHVILPILATESFLDAKVNVQWSTRYLLRRHGSQGNLPVFLWLSECAYSKEAARAVFEAVQAVQPLTRVFILLDEYQGDNIDPCRPYKLVLEEGELGLVFRSRWVSDAYAFSRDAVWLTQAMRSEILRSRPDLVGAAVDAETYGGAYDSGKPAFFTYLRAGLGNGVEGRGPTIPVRFRPVDKALGEIQQINQTAILREGSSWSNYVEDHLLRPGGQNRTGIIARSLSPLCRWTGVVLGNKGREESYLLVYDWVDPHSKKPYTRVVSSVWKYAFNKLRSRGAGLIRRIVSESLPSLLASDDLGYVLAAYGDVVFETSSWSDFASRFRIGSNNRGEATRLLLEAYRLGDQDAWMSDPTFWENFDTEVTWTSLALLAAGMIQAAKACRLLGDEKGLDELAFTYAELFLDFEATFSHQVRQDPACPLDLLYEYIRERGRRRGFDLEEALSSAPASLDSAKSIAAKAYELAFGTEGERPLYGADVNPFLILWMMHERKSAYKEAGEAMEKALAYEWEKSIRSAVSEKSIAFRVGLLHARHFPVNGRFSCQQEEVETDTEIIGGEAHVYT